MRRRPRPRDHRRLPRDSSTPIANCRGSCFFRSRTEIALEVLALRQQMGVLKRKRPRPRLSPLDRMSWTVLRTTWSHWRDALVIVKPETVVGWHRAGFRLYWRWKSRRRGGRPRITPELRAFDSPLGPGEYRLGRTEDPRRTAEARLYPVRANRRPLSVANAAEPRNGSHFFTTTARPSSPSTSSPFRPRVSECCTVSSSSSTNAVESCISTSRDIRPQIGSCNSFAKPFRRRPPIATPFWITIPSSTATSLASWRPPD